MTFVGLLLFVVPILFVGAVIVIVLLRYRRRQDQGDRATFASYVEQNLAPPQFSATVPGAAQHDVPSPGSHTADDDADQTR